VEKYKLLNLNFQLQKASVPVICHDWWWIKTAWILQKQWLGLKV